MSHSPVCDPDVTALLNDALRGDRAAEARVLELVFHELRRLAAVQLRGERPGHTLSPTALVNEAYIRLTGRQHAPWRNRSQFFGTAAIVMRRILVDHARAKLATKRGADPQPVPLDRLEAVTALEPWQLLALDRALTRLAALDPRQVRIVECRCFAGLDVRETARALGVSPTTVKREWQLARAWLYRELSDDQVWHP
jgi:RNA polymerase sigma-70 factor (ECF subfamily)